MNEVQVVEVKFLSFVVSGVCGVAGASLLA